MHGRLGRWAIVVALLAAGCHGPVPAAGAPATADDRTDVWFMQHMVPHLRQVSSIAFLNRDRITRPEVRRLARGLLVEQRADVRQLDTWRDAWAGRAHERSMTAS